VLYEQVEQEKVTLEQLQKDISGVTEIDAAVERAINQLIEQVNACRGYEKQAWETFKEIAKQLSDKKARELYYVMDTYRKNSANIVTYLQKDFTQYMQGLERAAHEQIDRIMTAIEELKKKNIDFKEQAKRLEQKKMPQPRVPEPQEEPEEEEQGFLMRIWSLITGTASNVWEVVSGAIHSVYTWIWPYGGAEDSSDTVALKV
jgi:hypothetical protein